MGWKNPVRIMAVHVDDFTGSLLYYLGYSSEDLFNLRFNMLKRGSL
jgi:hypothetical protein